MLRAEEHGKSELWRKTETSDPDRYHISVPWAEQEPVLFMHVHRRVYERSAGMGHVKEDGCRIGQERICQDERSARLGTGQSGRPDPFRPREPVYVDDVPADPARCRLHSIRIKAGEQPGQRTDGVILWQAQDPYPLTDRIVRGTGNGRGTGKQLSGKPYR